MNAFFGVTAVVCLLWISGAAAQPIFDVAPSATSGENESMAYDTRTGSARRCTNVSPPPRAVCNEWSTPIEPSGRVPGRFVLRMATTPGADWGWMMDTKTGTLYLCINHQIPNKTECKVRH
jgi:hypothetical protein